MSLAKRGLLFETTTGVEQASPDRWGKKNMYRCKNIYVYIYIRGGFEYLMFSPLPVPGEMIQFDEHIFQMGWFNHQLVYIYIYPI